MNIVCDKNKYIFLVSLFYYYLINNSPDLFISWFIAQINK